MALNQNLRPNLPREGLRVGSTEIPAPDQLERRAAAFEIGTTQRPVKHRGVERLSVTLVGQAVADEHAAGQPDRQGAARQKLQIRIADLAARGAVHFVNSGAKEEVEHLSRLADRKVSQLSQLVVAEEEMKPLGKLRLQLDAVL